MGEKIGSGVYFYQIQADDFQAILVFTALFVFAISTLITFYITFAVTGCKKMKIQNIWLTLVFLLYLSTLLVVRSDVLGAIWQMKQRDMFNTGRADYTVPIEKLSDSFFDVFLWQKLAPVPLSSILGWQKRTE